MFFIYYITLLFSINFLKNTHYFNINNIFAYKFIKNIIFFKYLLFLLLF